MVLYALNRHFFFYFVVPDIMSHYHPHLFRWSKILTDCAFAPQHRRLLLYFVYTLVIYGKIFGWLVRRMFKDKLSHHCLAIHVERYEKVGGYIGTMGDVVIFLYRRYVRGGEARRQTRKESGGLVIATDESPESLANRPLLPLSFTLFVDLFCLWRWLGLLGELWEGSPRVLAREIEDTFSTR